MYTRFNYLGHYRPTDANWPLIDTLKLHISPQVQVITRCCYTLYPLHSVINTKRSKYGVIPKRQQLPKKSSTPSTSTTLSLLLPSIKDKYANHPNVAADALSKILLWPVGLKLKRFTFLKKTNLTSHLNILALWIWMPYDRPLEDKWTETIQSLTLCLVFKTFFFWNSISVNRLRITIQLETSDNAWNISPTLLVE